MNVFEVLVVKNPTQNELDDGKAAEIVFGPEKIQAPNRDLALILLGHKLPKNLLESCTHRLQIHIKSF